VCCDIAENSQCFDALESERKTRPDNDIGDHELIISALKVRGIFESLNEPTLELHIMIEEVKAVGQAEIARDYARYRS
jgi:hypothetical protein